MLLPMPVLTRVPTHVTDAKRFGEIAETSGQGKAIFSWDMGLTAVSMLNHVRMSRAFASIPDKTCPQDIACSFQSLLKQVLQLHVFLDLDLST
jgi:hypothetical protein